MFAKLKFTIMVVGQRDSEAGQVDKGKVTGTKVQQEC